MPGKDITAHDIDFEIFGDDMQFVEIELDPQETAVAEAGAMMYMDAGIEMNTIFGDGSSESEGIMEKELGPQEEMRIDTGCLAALQSTVHYDVEFVGGIKTAIFGGEGLFFANVTGPGRVWLQSLPFSRIADRIIASVPRMGGQRRGEGSILGPLGDLLGGDRRF